MDEGRVTTSDRLLAQFRSEVISMFIRGLISTRYQVCAARPNFNHLNVIKAASTLNLTTITLGLGFEVCSYVEIWVDEVIIIVLNRSVENLLEGRFRMIRELK